MATRKAALSRGLGALLSDVSSIAATPLKTEDGELCHLPVEVISRGKYQPRKVMNPESLEELASSIRAQGIIQPIVVRKIENGRYEIIAGERRWRAAQLAGLSEIPVLVREISDNAAIAMALIENIQRENLNPIEEATALQRLLDEFQMTHQEVAQSVGKSRATVTNLLRLISLTAEVKKLVENGNLEMGHARALLSLTGAKQTQLANQVVNKGLSVRETENLVRKLLNESTETSSPQKIDPDIRHLQNQLGEKLGAVVQIKHGTKGRGKLVIQYNSLDELDGILSHIK